MDMKEKGSVFKGNQAFLIAEIGSNHNQDLSLALELIDAAAESGAQAVKFQSIRPDKLIYEPKMTEGDRRLLQKIQLDEEWYAPLFQRAKQKGIACFSAPTYLEAVDKLVESGAELMKIASPQTYGFPALIDAVAKTGLPTIMSTGYCLLPEIERAVQRFFRYGKPENLILLHCVSNYPTRPENANLRFMDTLRQAFPLPVGLSDHTPGWDVALAAVARGACVIEKHITFSRRMPGPDHHFALETAEFQEMAERIREVEAALGDGKKESLTPFEKDFREKLDEYPFARKSILPGGVIQQDDVYYRRIPDNPSLTAWESEKVLGRRAAKKIEQDTPVTLSCVEGL